MSELVTCAFGSISLKSIFTRALVRSQGIVTLSIHITTVCSIQTLICVLSDESHSKMNHEKQKSCSYVSPLLYFE